MDRSRASAVCPVILALALAGCGGAPDVDVWEFLDGDLTGLAEFDDARSLMFSSYDRTGGNDDGFSGLFSRLRVDENGEQVLAEMNGPGCIRRIWMTWPGRSTRLRIYIDGGAEPAVDLPIEELFSGERAPFLDPFVGGDRAFGGINFSYVPIPFEKSIRITTVDPIRFYQINAHAYPPETKLASFSFPPGRSFAASLSRARKAIAALPDTATMQMPWTVKPRRGDRVVELTDTLRPVERLERKGDGRSPEGLVSEGLASMEIDHPGEILEFRVSLEGADRAWRGTRMYAWWDAEAERPERGNASMSVPLAELSGSAFAPVSVRSVPILAASRTCVLRLPMPFRKALFGFANVESGEKVFCRVRALFRPGGSPGAARLHVVRTESEEIPPNLFDANAPWPGSRSHALLETGGRGFYVGTILSAHGGSTPSFLEGDENVVIDGDSACALHGTGTEDYCNSGWYFAGPRAWIPFSGVSFQATDPAPRISAYRWHLPDRIAFQDSLAFRLEIGDGAVEQGTRYATVALWYQEEPHRKEACFRGPPDAEGTAGFHPRVVVYPRHMVALVSAGPPPSRKTLHAENRSHDDPLSPRLPSAERGGLFDLPWRRLTAEWEGRPSPHTLYGAWGTPGEGADRRADDRIGVAQDSLRFPDPGGLPEGRYDVSLVYAKGPGLGTVEVWLDGRKLADRVDCDADTLAPVVLSPPVRMTLGGESFGVKFLVEPALSGARPDTDAGRFRTVIEADTLDGGAVRTRKLAALVAGILLRPTEPPIDRWLVVGPFDDRGGTKFDTAYAPEMEHEAGGVRPAGSYRAMGGKQVGWIEARADSLGFVNLREAIGPGTHRIAYGVAWVRSPRARAALFSFGSDDGAEVWLNGKRLHRWPVHRAWEDDQDRFTGGLRAGWNEILIKVEQGIAGWGFSLRLSDARAELLASSSPP